MFDQHLWKKKVLEAICIKQKKNTKNLDCGLNLKQVHMVPTSKLIPDYHHSFSLSTFLPLLTLGAHAQEGYCSLLCVFLSLLSRISPPERVFVLKILLYNQRPKEVNKFMGFLLKLLRSRGMV